MKKHQHLTTGSGGGSGKDRLVPFEITAEQAKYMGIDVDAVNPLPGDELDFNQARTGLPVDQMRKKMDAIYAKFQRKEPIFKEAAEFREQTARIFQMKQIPDWFSELYDDPLFRKFSALASQGTPDTHSTLMTWVVMKLRACSATSNWFRLSEALAYKLAATDLSGAMCGDLKLPMQAFYIEMPAGMFYIEDQTARRTGWHEVRTLTVTTGAITEKTLAIARASGDPTADMTPLGTRLLVECYAEPNSNSRDPFDDSWFFLSYRIFEDTAPIEKVLEDMRPDAREGTARLGEKFAQMRLGEHILSGAEGRSFLMKFILNFCVYLGTDKAVVKHQHAEEIAAILKGKKRKLLRKPVKERLTRLENDRVFLVGTDVVIDDDVKQYVRLGGEGYYKLTYRTMVRGHYRDQAWGPKHSLRRSKWIEPHVRGNELPTKVVGHNYEVK